jgi:guanylate kinase/SAM-dependent methyltransferase
MEAIGQTAFVAVSGLSGRGKTALVNALVNRFPSEFARPASVTTRPNRPGEGEDEYRFISQEEILSLHRAGQLVNLDCVFDNYYGIIVDSLRDVCASGRVAVKEIHHSNVGKIERAVDLALRVVVVGDDLRVQASEDASREEEHLEDDVVLRADIVVKNADLRDDPDRLIECVRTAIKASIRYRHEYPRPWEIEALNEAGYSSVISEFTDILRPTTRAFHEATRQLWSRFIGGIEQRSSCLELGVGNGWLRALPEWPSVIYTGTDIIPPDLLSLDEGGDGIVRCSPHNLPFGISSFDYVLGSLVDGCLYPQALTEVRRVLKADGRLVFSTPSREWSRLIRMDEHPDRTAFRLSDGSVAEVYSFAPSRDDLIALMSHCGFDVLTLISVGLPDFEPSRPLSEALAPVSELAQVGVNVPIVHFVMASPH